MKIAVIKEFVKRNNFCLDANVELVSMDLFFLQQRISGLLAPYLIKLESKVKAAAPLKGVSFEDQSLKKSIVKIANSPADYRDPSDLDKFIYISKNGIKNNELPKLLELFRVSRNKVMHADPTYLIESISSQNFSLTFRNGDLQLSGNDILDMFGMNLFNGPTAPNYPGKSWLQILCTTIFLFNKPKIARKVIAEIDYEIFIFISRGNIDSLNFHKSIGLHEDGAIKIK